MDRAVEIKVGLAVAALGVAYMVLHHGSTTPAVVEIGGQSPQGLQAATTIAGEQLQTRVALAQNAVSYLNKMQDDQTQLAIARVQGNTAVQVGSQAENAAIAEATAQAQSAQLASQNALQAAIAEANASVQNTKTTSAAQVTAAQAQAGAQKTSAFWGFLGNVASIFGL